MKSSISAYPWLYFISHAGKRSCCNLGFPNVVCVQPFTSSLRITRSAMQSEASGIWTDIAPHRTQLRGRVKDVRILRTDDLPATAEHMVTLGSCTNLMPASAYAAVNVCIGTFKCLAPDTSTTPSTWQSLSVAKYSAGRFLVCNMLNVENAWWWHTLYSKQVWIIDMKSFNCG